LSTEFRGSTAIPNSKSTTPSLQAELAPRKYAKQRFKPDRVLEQARVTEKLTTREAEGYGF
jgi:hypothetical protein